MATKTKFYNGNPLLPKAETKIEWTQENVDEYKKCMNDPILC